jgi:membrane-associated phospholipid phosphatase
VQPGQIIRRVRSSVLPDGLAGARGPGLAVAVLAGLYLLVAGLVATSVTAGLDADLWPWFDRFDQPGAAHLTIRVVYEFGQFSVVWAAVLVVSALVSRRVHSWRPFLAGGGTMAVLDGLMLAFKYPLGRTFPHSGQNEVFAGGEAFPSGHAAHATIAMLLLAAMIGRLRPPAPGRGWWGMPPWAVVPAVLLAFGAGVVNIMLGYHWTTDVVGGWIIGLMMFVIAHWLQRQGEAPAGTGIAEQRSSAP